MKAKKAQGLSARREISRTSSTKEEDLIKMTASLKWKLLQTMIHLMQITTMVAWSSKDWQMIT